MTDIILLSLLIIILAILIVYVKIYKKNNHNASSDYKSTIPSMEDISPDDPYAVAKGRYIHAREIIEKNRKLLSEEDMEELMTLVEVNINGHVLMQKEYDLFFRKFNEIKDRVNISQLKKLQAEGKIPEEINVNNLESYVEERVKENNTNKNNEKLENIQNKENK